MKTQSMSLDGFKKRNLPIFSLYSLSEESGRPRKRDSTVLELSDGGSSSNLPASTSIPRPRQRASHGHSLSLKGEAANLPSSPWPSFMEPLHTRQQVCDIRFILRVPALCLSKYGFLHERIGVVS